MAAAGLKRKASSPRGFTVNPLRASLRSAGIVVQRDTVAAPPSFTANPLCAAGVVDTPASLRSMPSWRAHVSLPGTASAAASTSALPPSGSAAVAAVGAGGAYARAASMRDLPAGAAAADARAAAAAAVARARFAPTLSDDDVDDFVNPLHDSHDGSGNDGQQRVRSHASAAGLSTAQKLIRQATVFDSEAMAHAARGQGGASSAVDNRGRRAFAVQAAGAVSVAAASDAAPGPRPLPPDWVELRDASSGNVYYHNSRTKETVWTRPTDVVDSADARPLPAVAASAALTASAPPLPPHWAEVLDASSGNVYYHNTLTGKTSWERPSEAAAGRIDGSSADRDTDALSDVGTAKAEANAEASVKAEVEAKAEAKAEAEAEAEAKAEVNTEANTKASTEANTDVAKSDVSAVETPVTETETAFAAAFAAAASAAAAATSAASLAAAATDSRRTAAVAARAHFAPTSSDGHADVEGSARADEATTAVAEARAKMEPVTEVKVVVKTGAGASAAAEAESDAAAKDAAATAATAAAAVMPRAETKVDETGAKAAVTAGGAEAAAEAVAAEAAVEVVTAAAAAAAETAEGAAAAGAGAAATAAEEEPAAIAGWTKTWSKTHATYYWREDSSGATSWEKPTPTPEGWVQDTADVRRHSTSVSRPRRSASRRFQAWKPTTTEQSE
jgi:hypothetical protein